jgi:hypothetical protein
MKARPEHCYSARRAAAPASMPPRFRQIPCRRLYKGRGPFFHNTYKPISMINLSSTKRITHPGDTESTRNAVIDNCADLTCRIGEALGDKFEPKLTLPHSGAGAESHGALLDEIADRAQAFNHTNHHVKDAIRSALQDIRQCIGVQGLSDDRGQAVLQALDRAIAAFRPVRMCAQQKIGKLSPYMLTELGGFLRPREVIALAHTNHTIGAKITGLNAAVLAEQIISVEKPEQVVTLLRLAVRLPPELRARVLCAALVSAGRFFPCDCDVPKEYYETSIVLQSLTKAIATLPDKDRTSLSQLYGIFISNQSMEKLNRLLAHIEHLPPAQQAILIAILAKHPPVPVREIREALVKLLDCVKNISPPLCAMALSRIAEMILMLPRKECLAMCDAVLIHMKEIPTEERAEVLTALASCIKVCPKTPNPDLQKTRALYKTCMEMTGDLPPSLRTGPLAALVAQIHYFGSKEHPALVDEVTAQLPPLPGHVRGKLIAGMAKTLGYSSALVKESVTDTFCDHAGTLTDNECVEILGGIEGDRDSLYLSNQSFVEKLSALMKPMDRIADESKRATVLHQFAQRLVRIYLDDADEDMLNKMLAQLDKFNGRAGAELRAALRKGVANGPQENRIGVLLKESGLLGKKTERSGTIESSQVNIFERNQQLSEVQASRMSFLTPRGDSQRSQTGMIVDDEANNVPTPPIDELIGELRQKIREMSNSTALEARLNEVETTYRTQIDVIQFGNGTQLNMLSEETKWQQQQVVQQTTRELLRQLEKEMRR